MAKKPYIETAKNNYKNGKKPNIKKIIEYFVNLNISDTSKSVYISRFKKELKQIRDNPILEKLVLPKELSEKVFNIQKEKHENKTNLEISKEDINKILNLKNSNNFYDLVILLLLSSGRREQELLNLKPMETDDKNSFKFNGQMKKKDKVEYDVPLYQMDYKEFTELLNKMNSLKPNYHPDVILRNLRNKLRILLGNDKVVIHNLRMIYANLMYEQSDKTTPFPSYTQRLLGHESNKTSTHYNMLKLV